MPLPTSLQGNAVPPRGTITPSCLLALLLLAPRPSQSDTFHLGSYSVPLTPPPVGICHTALKSLSTSLRVRLCIPSI